MGEKALDRSEELQKRYPPTTAAILTESSRREGIDMSGKYTALTVTIPPVKYRSSDERRKDQLEAVAKLLLISTLLFHDDAVGDTLQRWSLLLLPVFYVPVWNFPTAVLGTPMQQARPP